MDNATQMWLMVNGSKLNSKDLPVVAQVLEKLEDSRANALMGVQIKSPLIALLLTLFLGQFGAGRFYAGSLCRGWLCLVLWGAGMLGLITVSPIVVLLGPAVWLLLLDCFCIWGEVQRSNLKKIQDSVPVAFPGMDILRKKMREHILVYWILFALLGGASVFGMFFFRDIQAAL